MSLLSEIKATVSSPQMKKAVPYIGAVLVVLLAVFTVYAVAVTPAKQPYRDALAQYKNVYNANVAFSQTGAALGTTTATDEQFTKNIEAARTALDTLTSETKSLAGQEVLTKDEGKALYDAFNTKLQAYANYNADILETIKSVRPVIYECNQTAVNLTESEASAQAVQTCATKLKAVEGVPDADYKQMVISFRIAYGKLATNISAAAKLKDRDGKDKAAYTTYTDEREQILADLNTASTTLSKNLQLHRAEVDITETAQALDDYLSKKSSIFSF